MGKRIIDFLYSFLINNVASSINQSTRDYIYKIVKFSNSSVNIRSKCYFQSPFTIEFGRNIFINKNCRFYNGYGQDNARVIIHDNVTIGFDNVFVTTSHKIGESKYRADYMDYYCSPIEIDDGVWITTNCTILPGVHIGRGCIIAAGAVVINDCEPNYLYGGVPAVKIRKLD